MNDNLGPVISVNTFNNNVFSKSRLNIAHINAQSLVPRSGATKFDEIKQVFGKSSINILGVSETWCKSFVSSNSINIDGYRVFRNDRLRRRGGGVCLYISENLKAKVIYERMDEGLIEALFLEVTISKGIYIAVGVIYLPGGRFSMCDELLADISSRYSNVIVMGDFNVNIFNQAATIRDTCSGSHLQLIHNSLPTHFDIIHSSSSLIDFFLVSNINLVKGKGQCQMPFLNSHHACICLSYDLKPDNQNLTYEYRDYKSFCFEKCRFDAASVDFSPLYTTADVTEKVEFFSSILRRLFNQNIPLKTYSKNISDDWMKSIEVRAAKINRDLASRAYSESRSPARFKIFIKNLK